MQQADVPRDYFYCTNCQLAISKSRQAIHVRKCRGENIQQPLAIPLKKPQTSDKITCKICEKTMSLDQYQYHRYLCTEPMIPCEFCNRQIYVFRWQAHQNNCSSHLEDLRKRKLQLVEALKRYFLLIHGVELEGQLSADTIRLLVNQVFPALQNMNKGMSSKQIEAIQRTKLQHQQLQMCSICRDGIYKSQRIMDLKCKHLFHEQCIIQWLKGHSNCPNCRCEIKQSR